MAGWDIFSNNASGRKIYVPRNSVAAYKSASYWSNYADYIVGYDFEDDGGSSELSFPIMLTSKEGTGYNRTVEPNEQTLALVQYINDNVEFDGVYWTIPAINEFIILDNEITFRTLHGYGSTTWDYFIAFGASNNYWNMRINPNGNITVQYID